MITLLTTANPESVRESRAGTVSPRRSRIKIAGSPSLPLTLCELPSAIATLSRQGLANPRKLERVVKRREIGQSAWHAEFGF